MELVKAQIRDNIKLIYKSSRETIFNSYGLKLDGRGSIYHTGGSMIKMQLHSKHMVAVREPLYSITEQLQRTMDNRFSSRYYLQNATRLLNNLEGI